MKRICRAILISMKRIHSRRVKWKELWMSKTGYKRMTYILCIFCRILCIFISKNENERKILCTERKNCQERKNQIQSICNSEEKGINKHRVNGMMTKISTNNILMFLSPWRWQTSVQKIYVFALSFSLLNSLL